MRMHTRRVRIPMPAPPDSKGPPSARSCRERVRAGLVCVDPAATRGCWHAGSLLPRSVEPTEKRVEELAGSCEKWRTGTHAQGVKAWRRSNAVAGAAGRRGCAPK